MEVKTLPVPSVCWDNRTLLYDMHGMVNYGGGLHIAGAFYFKRWWRMVDCPQFIMLFIYRNCVPVRWSVWRGSYAQSECHQCLRCTRNKAVGTVVQLRPRSAGIRDPSMEGQSREHCCGAGRVHQTINGTTSLALSFILTAIYRTIAIKFCVQTHLRTGPLTTQAMRFAYSTILSCT